MKNLKIWQKTTIAWGLHSYSSVDTDILVDDWFDKKEKYFHTISRLNISSLSERDENGNRQAIMEVRIMRVSVGPTTARNEIINKLMRFDSGIIGVKDSSFSEPFTVRYALEDGESFCDSAIKKVQKLFEVFGIKDEGNYLLANFLTFQETLVLTKKGPIPFADYLRGKYKLPQACSLWGNKVKVGNLVYTMRYDKSESDFLNFAK